MMIIKEQLISEIKERIALQKDLLKRAEDSSRIEGSIDALLGLLNSIDLLQQETSEINLEKFTEKMEDWKARYNHPDNIPIKATMAFTARMFYMYPDIARQWYDSLPKVTQD